MSTEKNWKDPVFVDPSHLEDSPCPGRGPEEGPGEPAAKSTCRAPREVPLDSVFEVAEEDRGPAEEKASPSAGAGRESRRLRRRFFWTIGLLLALIVGWETYSLVSWGLEQNLVLGLAVAGLVCCTLAAGYSLVRHERAGAGQLKKVRELQGEAEKLQRAHETGQAVRFVRRLKKVYTGTDMEPILKRELKEIDWGRFSDAKAMTQVSRRGLKTLDEQAFGLTVRRSVEAGVLVSISPLAILDMLLVLWRNTRMLQDIAAIYGLQATLTSRFVLFRKVLYNMAFVGVSELVTEIGSDLFGWSVAAKLSARIGQGIGAGLLTGRMGIQAMHLCRPIPFAEQERPRLKEIRSRVLTRLTPETGGA